MSEHSPHEKSLRRVMVLGTASAFGLLGAIVVSMKDFFGGNAAFQFSFRTVLGFLVGVAVGFLFWWLVGLWQKSRSQGP